MIIRRAIWRQLPQTTRSSSLLALPSLLFSSPPVATSSTSSSSAARTVSLASSQSRFQEYSSYWSPAERSGEEVEDGREALKVEEREEVDWDEEEEDLDRPRSSAESTVVDNLESPPPSPLKLRPFQADAVESCLEALASGKSRIGVSAPTGSGKTAIFTALVKYLPALIHPSRTTPASRVLIIVGSTELAQQAANTVKIWWRGLSVEIEQGGLIASGMADCTVATYQTLARNQFRRLQKFDPTRFKAVIVDEAHHSAAKSYIEILSYFDSHIKSQDPAKGVDFFAPEREILPFYSPSPLSRFDKDYTPPSIPAKFDEGGRARVPIIGFTATFERADNLALGRIYESIVWHADFLQMIEARWLSQVRFTTIPLGESVDLDAISVSSSSKDFVVSQLATVMDSPEVNKIVTEAYMAKASERRSTLVFVTSIDHIYSLVATFQSIGVDARGISSEIADGERASRLADFKAGEFPVLVNCGILTEGADFPNIDCVMLARPTQSKNLFMQMLGRGLRLAQGKKDCLIIDFVGSTKKHHLVSAPRLFGLDPLTVLNHDTPRRLEEMAEEQEKATREEDAAREQAALEEANRARISLSNKHYNIQYHEYDSPWELLGDREGRPIHWLSRISWLSCGPDTFVLSLMNEGYIKVQPSIEGLYTAHFHPPYKANEPPAYSKVINQHRDLATLISRCDAYVNGTHEELVPALYGSASWRTAPPSPAQLTRIANKLRIEPTDFLPPGWIDGSKNKRVEELTKGEANDIITRLIHGGRGVVAKHFRAQKREEKARLKKERQWKPFKRTYT